MAERPGLRRHTGPSHPVFFVYVAGHLGIVVAALFLVADLRLAPRWRAIGGLFAVTAAYTAFVGAVDWMTGMTYWFPRSPASEWTRLRLAGPQPWHVLSAAGIALVLVLILDPPFWPGRWQGEREGAEGREGPGRGHPAAAA